MERIFKVFGFTLAACLCLAGCSSERDGMSPMEGGWYGSDAAGISESGSSGSGSGNSLAGKVTAGEWNDLDNWDFWSRLMTTEDSQSVQQESEGFARMSSYWGFFTSRRIAVSVADKAGNPVQGAKVQLLRGNTPVWTAVTDNTGQANCWADMFHRDEEPGDLSLSVNGRKQSASVNITGWKTGEEVKWNKLVTADIPTLEQTADIAFIVDATGSMGDEIRFLKDDLLDILNKTSKLQGGVNFRTSALFYRDEGDEYVTRVSDFSTDFDTTMKFIDKQSAGGGGDYPEAVHTALETGLQKLSWGESSKTKLAFMLLDAPAHHEDSVIASMQKSIQQYAALGIKLIPVAASGVDKNTEFMLRFFSVATGGTYVFITNDSGIGNDHIAASVGDYQVELLNELISRLILKYSE